MSITRAQANTNSQAGDAAVKAAANARFIAAADQQIAEATAQGVYFINAISTDDIDPVAVAQYYLNLGYAVTAPEYSQNQSQPDPMDLFGDYWIDFWLNGFIPQNMKKPYRFLIAWKSA